MWTFKSSNGELLQDGSHVAVGYSGHGIGKNNPTLQDMRGVGPIPVGLYTIGQPHDTDTHGPFVMRLTPDAGDEEFGRAGFLMHGDSISHPGEASLGCIIMNIQVRKQVWASGDHRLEVIL